jgi:hypothetical protein
MEDSSNAGPVEGLEATNDDDWVRLFRCAVAGGPSANNAAVFARNT